MNRHNHSLQNNWRYAAKFGFRNGIILAYVYSLVFISYAIIRSSLTILDQLPAGKGLWSTLAGNAFSLILSSLAIATVIIAGPAILGMISAIVIDWWLSKLGDRSSSFKIASIGFFSCLVISIILQILVLMITGYSWIRSSPGAYCFWLGFPTILYVVEARRWAAKLFGHRNAIHEL